MKYPFEIASSIIKKDDTSKTFSIEARFTRRAAEDDKPILIFDDHFSRFVFNILIGNVATFCNVPIESLAFIKKTTEYAFNRHMDCKMPTVIEVNEEIGENNTEKHNSPAYTEKFVTGSLKGKTPAQVLLENGEKGKEILKKQSEWLTSNLTKFPNNQKLIDAIKDAESINIEELKGSSDAVKDASTQTPISILEIGCRPLTRKTRKDGMCLCYECQVTWHTDRNYPVKIKITNYYAPVTKKGNGAVIVNLSGKDKSSEIVNEFNLTAADWVHMVEEMDIKRQGFEYIYLKNAIELAEKAERENREAYKKAT